MMIRRKYNSLANESGIAAIMLVVFSIVILASIGLSFFVETQQKHQGAALTATSTDAYMLADAGMRYANKCLTTNKTDPGCPCNSGPPNDCSDYPNLQDFSPISFAGGQFIVTFSNKTACGVEVASKGMFKGAERQIHQTINASGSGGLAAVNAQQAKDKKKDKKIKIKNYAVPSNSGSDLLLVVIAGAQNKNGKNAVPKSAKFGGTGMTKVNFSGNTYTAGGGNDAGIAMFFLAVSPGQTGDISVKFPKKMDTKTVHAVTLASVLTTGPESTAVANADGVQVTANIITQTNGSMVLSGVHHLKGQSDFPFPVGPGHTLIGSAQESKKDNSSGAMGQVTAATAGPVNGIGYASNDVARKILLLASFAPSGACP